MATIERPGTSGIEHRRSPLAVDLMSGMIADAVMLVREERATAADVDLAMQLGAGYPVGPLTVLADSPGDFAALFGKVADDTVNALASGNDALHGPIALVGTGTMAGGIAEAIARSGRKVMVLYRSEASYEAMMMRVARSLARSVEKGRFTAADSDGYLRNIAMTNDARQLADCALVIEAVKEDLDAKRRTLAMLHAALPGTIPFATNTSSFRVADMAAAAPGRPVFAMHFFNPAQAMKLVELVFPDGTDPTLRAAADSFVREIGKVPVACADHRGFVVNRLLIPFLNDAVRAHEGGVAVEEIDRVMVEEMGHPMGPFALIDMIGIDVMILALESMAETEGDPRIMPADTFYSLVDEGRLGRKSGRGFHDYGSAK